MDHTVHFLFHEQETNTIVKRLRLLKERTNQGIFVSTQQNVQIQLLLVQLPIARVKNEFGFNLTLKTNVESL